MSDLSISYLGLPLRNPVVAAASPLTADLETVRRMAEAGVAAVVLPSLFEEQIELYAAEQLDHLHPEHPHQLPRTLRHLPHLENYNRGLKGYLGYIEAVKAAVDFPVIASLNVYRNGGWARYAASLQKAGADALEVTYFETPSNSRQPAELTEQPLLDLLGYLKSAVSIPVSLKLTPYASSPAYQARRLSQAGADGLALFKRLPRFDFDLETLEISPQVPYSTADDLGHSLRWAALIHAQLPIDLAITGGVYTAEDVLKSVMAGAKAAMLGSALLRHGVSHIANVLAEVEQWLRWHDYEYLTAVHGLLSRHLAAEPALFERTAYMDMLAASTIPEG